MTKPLDIDAILGEFSVDEIAWVIMDVASGARLNVPDGRYPATEIVRFFMSGQDAERFIEEVERVAERVRDAVLVAVPVPLIRTAKAIASARSSGKKIGYVVHSPNEVFETFG